VIREGYRLNNPLLPGQGILMESLAHTGNPAVVLETIKPAEEGGGVVLRLYECLGAPTYTVVYTRLHYKRAFEADLLERKLAPADLARLEFGPFEIKTILLEEGRI
jgi:alpha-mannosidase